MRALKFWNDPGFSAVVVTGPPSSGKSSVLKAMRDALNEAGCIAVTLTETPTELSLAGLSLAPVFWDRPLDFQRALLDYGLVREEMYYQMLKLAASQGKHLVLLVDGGVPRSEAYIGRENYLRILEERDLDRHRVLNRYRAVIYLAAPPKDHYTTANNAARSESVEQAAALDDPTFQAWNGHQHLIVVKSAEDFEEKKQNAIRALSRVIPMPQMIECEHKVLLIGFHLGLLPDDTVSKEIEQDYLVRKDPRVERRVRSERGDDGSTVYFYTEKAKIKAPGSRAEEDDPISRSRYEELLREKDPERATVRKRRHSFRHRDQLTTVDEFHDVVLGDQKLFLAEQEVPDLAAVPVRLPADWAYLIVTDNEEYKNSSIARRIAQGKAFELLIPYSATPEA